MLKTYIDASGRGQKTGDFVMAGYVAPVENWLLFNHAWQAVLNIPPKVEYFHTVDAMAKTPTGSFDGWTREECDARIYQLLGVIHSYGLIRVRVSIPHGYYSDAFHGKVGKRFNHPSFLPTYSVIMVTARALAHNGVTEKTEFVFDCENPREERFLMKGWEAYWQAMDMFPDEYAPMKTLLGRKPEFKSDREILPLQAADLFAWFARQHSEARERGEVYQHLAWQSLCAVPGPQREWTASELIKVVSNAQRMMAMKKQQRKR
jgi:hypothetical protein